MSFLSAPDPSWPSLAQAEADRWRGASLSGLVAIHHIGSTAVTGLPAKPVIDLLPVFDTPQQMDASRPALEALGYEWLGEFGLPGRRYVRLDDPQTGVRRVQAHCYVSGSAEIDRHLAFRDALLVNPTLRAGYSAIKAHCAARHPDGGADYGRCKSGWIDRVERKAMEART